MKKIITILFLFNSLLTAQNPVLLQPWVEVFGTTNGSNLGVEIKGFIPHTNFNYRSGIFQSGVTGFYTHTSVNDMSPSLVISGMKPTYADLNGDGNGDLIIRRYGHDLVSDTVVIFWGTINGFDSINTTKLIGEDKSDLFGSTICVGNIVGDSLTDLVITAPGYSKSAGQGKVYTYKGSQQFSTTPFKTLLGDSINYSYGWNCVIGDVNNDGYNDLFIRGYNQNTQPTRYAYLDIYWGSTNFDTIRDVRILGKDISRNALACFDANGDGIDDLLWTNRDSLDWVYIHYGGSNFSKIPSVRLKDPPFSEYFGVQIVNAGDMNGDGYNDIVVGTEEGQVTSYVYVYAGGPKINGELDAYYTISQCQFGSSVASVGDVNSDGLSDIIVGAYGYPSEQNKGYWGIFLGSTNIKVTSVKKEEPQKPQYFELLQNYPNPFNNSTTIPYVLEKEASVTIKIANTLGQEITTYSEGEKSIGMHQVKFDAKNLSSGWYVYTITVIPKNSPQSYSQSRAMILEK